MARVYLETSFISACVSTREDAASVARRNTSLEWWRTQRGYHEAFVSAEVVTELDADWPGRAAALELARSIPVVRLTPAVAALAELLVRERVMPARHRATRCMSPRPSCTRWITSCPGTYVTLPTCANSATSKPSARARGCARH